MPKMLDSYALSCNDSLSCKCAVCMESRMARDLGPVDDILKEHAIEPTAECQDWIDIGQCCSKDVFFEKSAFVVR